MWCGSRSPACPGSFFLGALLQRGQQQTVSLVARAGPAMESWIGAGAQRAGPEWEHGIDLVQREVEALLGR
jgi:hypothetical protein